MLLFGSLARILLNRHRYFESYELVRIEPINILITPVKVLMFDYWPTSTFLLRGFFFVFKGEGFEKGGSGLVLAVQGGGYRCILYYRRTRHCS